jgi:Undecaprenyl-phosphate galactose phosphotransferase WbaP
MVSTAGSVAVWLRYLLDGHLTASDYALLVPFLALFPAIFGSVGLYPGIAANPIRESRRICVATGTTYLMIVGATFLVKQSSTYSRLIFLFGWVLSVLLVPLGRAAMRSLCARRSWWGVPTVVFGGGPSASKLLDVLYRNSTMGLRPIALVNETGTMPAGGLISDSFPVYSLEWAPCLARRNPSCYAILLMDGHFGRRLSEVVSDYASEFSEVLVMPDLAGLSSLWVSAKDLGGMVGLEVNQVLARRFPRKVKRIVDLLLAAVVGVVLFPMIGVLYLAVRLTSSGPAFYGQWRIGCENRPFMAWKFRTMVRNADRALSGNLEANPRLRCEWERNHKLKSDPRVTSVGRLLRRYSLDELPQIWNVFQGDMSLVGPRPIVAAEVPRYGKRFAFYQKVRPGLTGLWQISGRNNTTYEQRTEFDEYYVRNWSVWLDVYILARTVKTVLLGEGAY